MKFGFYMRQILQALMFLQKTEGEQFVEFRLDAKLFLFYTSRTKGHTQHWFNPFSNLELSDNSGNIFVWRLSSVFSNTPNGFYFFNIFIICDCWVLGRAPSQGPLIPINLNQLKGRGAKLLFVFLVGFWVLRRAPYQGPSIPVQFLKSTKRKRSKISIRLF